jgi:hypothetical protein
MSAAALVLAILSLGISATLAAIKVWETFLSRSRFFADFQWFDDVSDTELRLSFTVANIGHRPDSIRLVHVRAEDGEVAFPPEVETQFPILLQPAEISARFDILVRTDVAWDPATSMFVGTADLVVVNSVGREDRFPIPNPYDVGMLGADEPPPPESRGAIQ